MNFILFIAFSYHQLEVVKELLNRITKIKEKLKDVESSLILGIYHLLSIFLNNG
jgi:hypothetical protein